MATTAPAPAAQAQSNAPGYDQQQQDYQQKQDDYRDAQARYQDQSADYAAKHAAYERLRAHYEHERDVYDARNGSGSFDRYYRLHRHEYDEHYGPRAPTIAISVGTRLTQGRDREPAEPVTHPRLGDDVAGGGRVGLQFLAQVADEDAQVLRRSVLHAWLAPRRR